jgi:hypothetical protein
MMNKLPWHVPTKKWMMKISPKKEWWLKRKIVKHKKTIQTVGTIGLIPHKVPKRRFQKMVLKTFMTSLQHHPIKMHIQSYTNTMNHYLTPTLTTTLHY